MIIIVCLFFSLDLIKRLKVGGGGGSVVESVTKIGQRWKWMCAWWCGMK